MFYITQAMGECKDRRVHSTLYTLHSPDWSPTHIRVQKLRRVSQKKTNFYDALTSTQGTGYAPSQGRNNRTLHVAKAESLLQISLPVRSPWILQNAFGPDPRVLKGTLHRSSFARNSL